MFISLLSGNQLCLLKFISSYGCSPIINLWLEIILGRGISLNFWTVFCTEDESVHHLFHACIVARAVWSMISDLFKKPLGTNYDFVARFWVSNNKNSAINIVCTATMWCLWKFRNSMIFSNTIWSTIKQVGWNILKTIRHWMILSKDHTKLELEAVCNSLLNYMREPLLILSG